MKIFVCFQVLKDYDQLNQGEWAKFVDDESVLSYVISSLNTYDESALENALALKERFEGATLTAVTVGNQLDNSGLYKNLFAVGVDDMICCNTQTDLVQSPRTVGATLAELCREADIVLMGQKSAKSMSGMTPYVVAHQLGYEVVPNVVDFLCEDTKVVAHSQRDHCIEVVPVAKGYVYTMGNAVHSYLRLATLREKLKVGSKQPQQLDGVLQQDDGISPDGYRCVSSDRQCAFLSEDMDIGSLIVDKVMEIKA